MTPLTLVSGGSAAERDAALAAVLTADAAVIVEGLTDGSTRLADAGAACGAQIVRIAPGCLCCSGQLVLRVTLNRLLRRPPARLFISLANASHLDQLRLSLSAAPYDGLLGLGPDLVVPSAAHA